MQSWAYLVLASDISDIIKRQPVELTALFSMPEAFTSSMMSSNSGFQL